MCGRMRNNFSIIIRRDELLLDRCNIKITMKILIVFAHPEPRSFGRALLDRSMATLTDCGHEVVVSDLYAMGFNPVATGDDFTQRRFPDAL